MTTPPAVEQETRTVALLHPCHGDTYFLDKEAACYGRYVSCPTCRQPWETWISADTKQRHWSTSSLGMTVSKWRLLEDRVRRRGWVEFPPTVLTFGVCEPT